MAFVTIKGGNEGGMDINIKEDVDELDDVTVYVDSGELYVSAFAYGEPSYHLAIPYRIASMIADHVNNMSPGDPNERM